jgi:antitoxin YefM
MTAIAYTQFRKRLDEFFAQAEDEAVIITRSDGQDRVLISKQEYESLLETAHLLSTTANANRLQSAMTEIEAEIARRSKI